jgi:ribonucleoside-diphosphate reductase alpha chain
MLQAKIERTYSEFIAKRTYTRWLDAEGRRESWVEAVERYGNYFGRYVPESLRPMFASAIEYKKQKDGMGSMRALWSAGPALEENSFAAYNCAYVSIDDFIKFGEILYIMMHGTGVGFSVERQFVHKLPEIPGIFKDATEVHVVGDSKLGWKLAFDHCIFSLAEGITPKFDYSEVRPKGARLKTFGGRASGPDPLKQLFNFATKIFHSAAGRKLNSLECHDLATKTGECVVVGGVRRSACVSFSNLSDQRMKHAKDGQFWLENPQRTMANNSIAYTEKPDSAFFMEEWLNLIRSGTGERGIFNATAAREKANKWGRSPGDVRSNPCVEALLKDRQLCNLTEVVVRPEDTIEDLKKKIDAAVLLGCLQAMETNFLNIHEDWKKNAEAERLIGVGLTGVCDSPLFRKTNDKVAKLLKELHRHAHETAAFVAKELGITCPMQIALIKPSGTVSQLVNCSSGLHTRYADYYIRRVRVNAKDPIAYLLISKGVPCNPEVGQSWEEYSTLVFDFPMKSPRGSLNRNDFTALEQLEYWKMFNDNWCDGNPSVTIYVKEDEWVEVGAWVYKNWDSICGLSFLPFDSGHYQLAPYEEVTKSEYYELVKPWKDIEIDFDHELNTFELEDSTTGAQTLACTGGSCEL